MRQKIMCAQTTQQQIFLGTKLDRTLSFVQHTNDTTAKVNSRIKLLRAVSSRDWGWSKQTLKKIYLAVQRSVLDYSASAWQPFLSESQFSRLERSQNSALRAITGQACSTPIEALRIEAGVFSYRTQSNKLIMISHQKALRLPPNHPKAKCLLTDTNQRLQKDNWRHKALSLLSNIPAKLTGHFSPSKPLPPWKEPTNLVVNDTIYGMNRGTTLQSVLKLINSYEADTVIYTDGSATAGTTNGGYAVICTIGPAESPTVTNSIGKRGRTITSSYDEEKAALLTALKWIRENQMKNILICTDSQSLCKAITSQSADTMQIRDIIASLSENIHLQWIPGHMEIPGNEMADTLAKEATKFETKPEETSLKAAISVIKRHCTDALPTHNRIKISYKGYNPKKEAKVIKKKKDAVLLAQLRSGHSRLFRAYAHLMDPTIDPMCPKCNGEAHTAEHWIQCQATLAIQHQLTGRHDHDLSILSEEPAIAIELARKTLLGSK